MGLKDTRDASGSVSNIPRTKKTKKTEVKNKNNFFAPDCTEELFFEFTKYTANKRINAKLKIWLRDPKIPKEIRDNKIRELKKGFLVVIIFNLKVDKDVLKPIPLKMKM